MKILNCKFIRFAGLCHFNIVSKVFAEDVDSELIAISLYHLWSTHSFYQESNYVQKTSKTKLFDSIR